MDIFFRYLHFISIITISASLVAEHLLLAQKLPRSVVKKISLIDAIYGISSITLVISGLMQWFYYGKGASYYSQNWIFHTKLGLAILLGVLSLPPTVFFLKSRKGQADQEIHIPNYVKVCLRLELLTLFLIPLLAVLMAKGHGFSV